MTGLRTPLVAALAVAGLLLASCSSNDAATTNTRASTSTDAGSPAAWNDVVAAANKEGEVVVYSGSPESTNDSVKAAFEAAYPKIHAQIIRLNSSEIVPRVDTERKTKSNQGADVLSNTLKPWLTTMADAGDLAPMTGPAYTAVLKSTYAKRPALADDRSFGTYISGAWQIVWNTDLVKKPIKGYADLIARAKEFTGQVAMPDLYGDVVVEYYRNIQVGADGVGDPAKSEMLKGLAALKPKFYDSVVPITAAVAAGEVKVGLYSVGAVWQPLKAKGAPITGISDPKIPASANVYLAATAYAPHPNAAQVFTNFMFTSKGQTATGDGFLTILPDIKGSTGGPDAMTDPRTEMTDPKFTASFGTAWDSLFR